MAVSSENHDTRTSRGSRIRLESQGRSETMSLTILSAAAGAITGLGVYLMLAAWRGTLSFVASPRRMSAHKLHPVLASGIVLVATWLLTRWILASVVAAAVTFMGVLAATRQSQRRDDRALVEGIAVWTEQLRDMLAGSNGLEQTISSTAPHAPYVLRKHVERLVASMAYAPLSIGLRRFAREIDHPTADFVVAALTTASTRQVREMGSLLGHLAACARDEARMHTRIWVGRSRTRSAVRIIASVVGVFVIGLVTLAPDYLEPYQTTEGQIVLSGIILLFFGALLMMQRLAVIAVPERFIGRRTSGEL